MTSKPSDLNGVMCGASAMGPLQAYRPNLRYEVERVSNEGEKRLSLVRLLRETAGGGVIYAATVREGKAVADYLKRVGLNIALHPSFLQPHPHMGQSRQSGRSDMDEKPEDCLLSGAFKATIAISDSGSPAFNPTFGHDLNLNRGGDIDMESDRDDIRFVIHYNMPRSLEDYYRESARAGRDGLPSRCVLLFQIADRRAGVSAMNGRSPKSLRPEEVIAVYAALAQLGADLAPAPLELIQASASEAPKIKVRAILSLLKNMGFIKERRGARYTLLKRDLGEQEMKRLAGEYTSKGESDREKLERMTLYAQSPECRWKLMLEHLGAHMEQTERMGLKACGHCDNCTLTIAEQARAPEGMARPDFIDLLFVHSQGSQERQKENSQIKPGDVVKLPAHGEVRVKAIEGDKIVVSLPSGETRKFKQEWVIR